MATLQGTRDIVHAIGIKTTPQRLYEAITTQQGLAGWWTPATQAKPQVGAVNEFHFDGMTLTFRVEELTPQQRVVWSAVQVPPEWDGTRVTFGITPGEDATNLQLSHTGFASMDGMYGMTNYSWAQYVRSLKLLLETGQGEPYGSAGSRLAGTT